MFFLSASGKPRNPNARNLPPTPTCPFVAKYETDDQNALDSQQKHLDVGGNRRRRIHVGCSRRGGLAKREVLRSPGL